MQKVFNYRGAHQYFLEQLANGQMIGRSYVFLGKEGTGKTQVFNEIDTDAKAQGYKVYRTRSYATSEALMYQAYNELLNQLHNEFRERTLPQIVEEFSTLKEEVASRSIFIIDQLENMPQHSRELFIFLSRLAPKLGFTVFGSIMEDNVEDGHSIVRFLNLVASEPEIQIINFERANLEDIKALLKNLKYNLPSSFIQELFRLTNGNVRSLVYTLKYYEEQGIINTSGELEEVTYRYFPIPPSSEIRFDKIIRELSDAERKVIEIVALIPEEMSPSFISNLSQLERSQVLDALARLIDLGLVAERNLNYSIVNNRISDIIMNSVYSNGGYIISETFLKQSGFTNLPFITKLKVFELRKDPQRIEDLVNQNWRKFIDQMSYVGFPKDLFKDLSKFVTGKPARAHLAILSAQSSLNLGNLEEAIEIYNNPDLLLVEPVFTRLSAAKLAQRTDRYREAISMCKELLKGNDLQPYDRASAWLTIATAHSSLNQTDEGARAADESIKISTENKISELLADGYGTLGTIKIKKFDLKGALLEYEKALKICQELKLYDRELLMLNNIAIIYSYWGDFEQSASMLTEIIEKSYISGELVSRAYSTYNLCEIYFNIGRKEDFLSYFPGAAGLVRMLGDSNLSYPFFRFATMASFEMMSYSSGVRYAEELLKISKSIGNSMKEKLARGLYIIVQTSLNESIQKELESIMDTEITEADDFLPMWYFLSGIHYSLKDKPEKAHAAFERLTRTADNLGDSAGIAIARLGQAFELMTKGEKQKSLEAIGDGFKIGRDTAIYTKLTEQLIKYCMDELSNADRESMPESTIHLAAMILMDMKPAGVQKEKEDDRYSYFIKCREIIGKRMPQV
ncbi:MAG: hypothetical protein M1129_05410 [Candidatus Thermoplasmatota archaeon]|jgi:tetratricopeptide (TPR) repeat protein|nr:hypothetical protein [Candidatus Thermoplasmatota archaeon]